MPSTFLSKLFLLQIIPDEAGCWRVARAVTAAHHEEPMEFALSDQRESASISGFLQVSALSLQRWKLNVEC